jgi:hypothetical protein
MFVKNPKFLYSTNAMLSYLIAENFFDGKHFVWCAPVFNPNDCDALDINKKIPHSSSPHGIYTVLTTDIKSDDNHSSKIQSIKTGLIKGTNIKFSCGVIDEGQYRRILEMIENSKLIDFYPLIYIIDTAKIEESRLIRVPVKDSANGLSTEFQIHDLKTCEFDTIKI